MMTNKPQPVLYLLPKFPTKSDEDQSIPLYVGEWTVGRNGETDISLPKGTVSRIHAKLIVEAKSITVVDLGSSNGVKVGAEQVKAKKILPGQEILFGDFPMILSTTPVLTIDDIKTAPLPPPPIVPPARRLTPAQNRVFLWLIRKEAFSEKEIAAKLHRSSEVVHNHVRAIYAAYEVHSKAELLMKVYGLGHHTVAQENSEIRSQDS